MPREALLDSETRKLGDLLSNGRLYEVPPYQRDYAWDEEQWDDLWTDVVELEKASQPHFMGTVVLGPGGERTTVIDGQQRLVTLSILALAVLRAIKARSKASNDEEEQRFVLLRNQYIGSPDPTSLLYRNRLRLNRTDDWFYERHVVPGVAPVSVRKLTDSQRRLWRALEYFDDRVANHFPAASGSDLASFLNDTLARRLLFTVIFVDDEVSAYSVFETLNARGTELTATDLLKNYLFSKCVTNPDDERAARAQWERIVGPIGQRDVPAFLRHWLNSRGPLVRQERLYKELRGRVTTPATAFELMDALERAAVWYRALEDGTDEFWRDFPGCAAHVTALGLFRVTQVRPLLLACLDAGFPPSELERVLHACVVISLRFSVIGRRNPNQLEKGYNEAAVSVFQKRRTNARAVIDALRPLYVEDAEFKSAFAMAAFPARSSKKLIRWLLAALDSVVDESRLSVEHLLPENPGDPWLEVFDPAEVARWTERLGNLALVEPHLNRAVGNQPWADKRVELQKSAVPSTREVALQYEEWTPEAIERRQQEMASRAAACWRLDFPG